MIKPLFAKEKELERNFSSGEAVGATVLRVASPSDFEEGDRVFCSEADGSDLEYPGVVVEVGVDSITTQFGLASARDASALLWRAAGVFQWETVEAEPLERRFISGVAVERSVGGALWSTRVAAEAREEVVRFPNVSRACFLAFRAWLGAWARGGLDDFTWVDAARQIATIRLLDCDFEQVEKTPRVVGLTLRLAVIEDGGYA